MTIKRLTLAALLCAAFITVTQAQAPANASWQVSQSASAELSIRDKSGTTNSYEAEFIVTAPDGKKFNREIIVEGKDWGTVSFPDDFDTFPRTGRFSWVCMVNGEMVSRGRFRLTLIESPYSFSRQKKSRP
jgi:hypothetical protein